MRDLNSARVGVVGLGYVGLPLAVEFGRRFPTTGFDIKSSRVAELKSGHDSTLEVEPEALDAARQLEFTDSIDDLSQCNVFIVGVPTPINAHKWPDLRPLESASRTVGKVLKPGDLVIYESTVYPGATEEVCVPILEEVSGLTFNTDFFAGYSPERINPGDKVNTLKSITKITSGSTPEAAEFVDQLYRSVIEAGTHKAGCIRVAEAAKVIENTQRDVNIALINELALIFNRLGIDTEEVLDAAGTKWNFLPFKPGLVGGHCIGVDPYYLTHKALEAGYQPTIIPASRLLNDGMGHHVGNEVVRLMARNGLSIVDGKVLMLGFAFKENCPDLRNTRAIDIIHTLREYNGEVDIYDPWVDRLEAEKEYGVSLIDEPAQGRYDAIVVAVGHDQFRKMGIEKLRAFGKPGAVVYDAKYIFPAQEVDGRL